MHPFANSVKKILLVLRDDLAREDLALYLASTEKFSVFSYPSSDQALVGLASCGRIDAIVAECIWLQKTDALMKMAVQDGIPTIFIAAGFEESVQALRSFALKIPVLKHPVEPEKLAHLLIQYTGGERAWGTPYLAAWWDDEAEQKPASPPEGPKDT